MLIYFAGIASCGVQGAKKGNYQSGHGLAIIFSAVLASFGGGLIRDVGVLHVYPVLLTPECRPDIAVAVIASFMYLCASKNSVSRNSIEWFSTIADSSGLGTFIAIGVDKAMDMGTAPISVLFSGISTSLGGGILSSVFCGVSLLQSLSVSIPYRLLAIGGVILYSNWIAAGAERVTAQYAIIGYTTVTTLACNPMVTQAVSKRIAFVIKNKLVTDVMMSPYKAYVLYRPNEKNIVFLHDTNKFTYNIFMFSPKKTILYHCIRQM